MSTIESGALARALYWNAGVFGALLALCVLAILIDPRVVEGTAVWIKPAKFALSFGVHLATLALIVAWTQGSSRLFVWSVWAIVATAWIEFLLIALQAGRGVRSHFNVEMPFDAAVFTAMGIGVGALFVASITAALGLVWRAQTRNWPSIASSMAIIAGALGSLTAMAMVVPSDAQLAGFVQGVRISSGSRYPGLNSIGGEQIPILGWSLESGDYRIAHFFGVHAMQIVLVWGWLIQSARPRARMWALMALVSANAVAVLLLLWGASMNYGPVNAPLWLLASGSLAFAVQPIIVVLTRRAGPQNAF